MVEAGGGPRFDFRTQDSFLDHLYKDCLVRLGTPDDFKNRRRGLAALEAEVLRGDYSPRSIVGLLSAPKSAGVPRFIPVFDLRDYIVYFACVRALDEPLARDAIPGTFGGWSLGGARRRTEDGQAQRLIQEVVDDTYAPPSAYNPAAWVKNWNEYWKLLWITFRDSPEDSWFVSFDIANFYDSIDLPRLERLLRQHAPEAPLAIEVLSYLLGAWNNRVTMYARSSKGLPQDLIGDCSRVLANAYLLPFDTNIKATCDPVDARYFRYADDMVIAARTKADCERLLFRASEELNVLGLNINVAKVRYSRPAEFAQYWGFDVLSGLDARGTVLEAVQTLRNRWDDDAYGRKITALRRVLSLASRDPRLASHWPWIREQFCDHDDRLLELSECKCNLWYGSAGETGAR